MHKQLKVLAIKNFSVFSGEQSLEMAVETVKQQSRRYAKRQLTWFRNRMAAHWWDLVQQPTDLPKLERSSGMATTEGE